MKPYLTILNSRTLFVIVSAGLITYFSLVLNIDYYVDLTLLSIAIIFPLVFTIRGSFRRREKALEHLSKFRSAVKTIHYFGISDKGLMADQKSELTQILQELSERTMELPSFAIRRVSILPRNNPYRPKPWNICVKRFVWKFSITNCPFGWPTTSMLPIFRNPWIFYDNPARMSPMKFGDATIYQIQEGTPYQRLKTPIQ